MRFYTGFDSYETFSMVLDFLGRDAASQLNYKNNERSECNSRSTPGHSRTLRTENEILYGTVQIKSWSISGRYCSHVWCLSEPCVRDH